MSEGEWEQSLRAQGRTRKFTRGERLFLEGFNRGAVLIIHRGMVRIVATTPEGNEVTLALRGPGEVIGTHSALTDEPVGAGVVAVEDGEGTIVPADRYLALLDETPASMFAEVHRLVRMLHEAEERLTDIATQEVDVRVVRQLARLCRAQDPPVRLPLTQSDLASMVGAARATVAPVLAALRDQEAISTRRGEIVVDDPTALT